MTSFNEQALVAAVEVSPGAASENVFDTYESRQFRYNLLWAQFQSNAYRNVHMWSDAMKKSYDLYPHVRDIYNPTFRIGTFHQHHLWAGRLDPEAGNGEEVSSCFPIIDASSQVVAALKRLWRESNLSRDKNIYALQGAVFGDAFIKIYSDAELGVVKLQRIDPRFVSRKISDLDGNIIAYSIQYPVLKEDTEDEYIVYREDADLLPDQGVQYCTFADDQPFAWDGENEEWIAPYPFVPLIHIPHNDVGSEFGWAEAFPKLQTFREIDDIASKVSDQVRKMVDSIWMFSGIRKPKRSTTAVENASIGREELPVIYAPDPQAKPHPLVAQLDLIAALQHINTLMGDLESTFPELRVTAGTNRTSGDLSGRALLVARQEVEDKIRERRSIYDTQLVMAHKMAFIIGSIGNVEDFSPFSSVEGLHDDKMFHTIGSREVFTLMETERFEREKQLWINAALAQRVGVSLDIFLRREGWTDTKISEITSSEEYLLRQELISSNASVGGGSGGLSTSGEAGRDSMKLPDEAMLDPNKPFADFQVETS